MTLSPPRCSRLPGPYGPVAPALFPSVLHESPVFGTQDRIYCVPWCRRDKFTNRRYVDKATWREAFDHEAFHSSAAQGSAPRARGPSPLGGSVPRGLFLPGDKGVDRPIRQGIGTGVKLAENRWLCIRDSVIGPAHNPNGQALLCAPRQVGRLIVRNGGVTTGRDRFPPGGPMPFPDRAVRRGRGRWGAIRAAGHGGTRIRPSMAGVGPDGPSGVGPAPVRGAGPRAAAKGVTDTVLSGHREEPSGPLVVGVGHNRRCDPGPPRACSVKRRARFARVWAVEEWSRTLGGKGLGR